MQPYQRLDAQQHLLHSALAAAACALNWVGALAALWCRRLSSWSLELC